MKLAIGQTLPVLERLMDEAGMVAYGAATWDWHRLHYDKEYCAHAGLPGPLVDGQMFGALIAEQILDALGPRAWITTMAFRFKTMVFAGETLRVEAAIVAAGDVFIETAHTIRSGDAIAAEGTATVRR
ncbi:MAG TPA: MaoC/PaaZ C-terminal domain-containing protein [Actinomycetota bacterium]